MEVGMRYLYVSNRYLGNIDKVVVPQRKNPKVLEVPDLRAQLVKIVVTKNGLFDYIF